MPAAVSRVLALERPEAADLGQAARYMGARGEPDPATRALLERCAPPLLAAAAPRAVWLRAPVEALTSEFVPRPEILAIARWNPTGEIQIFERKHLHNLSDVLPEHPLAGSIRKCTLRSRNYLIGSVVSQDDYPDAISRGYACHQQHDWDAFLRGGVGLRCRPGNVRGVLRRIDGEADLRVRALLQAVDGSVEPFDLLLAVLRASEKAGEEIDDGSDAVCQRCSGRKAQARRIAWLSSGLA